MIKQDSGPDSAKNNTDDNEKIACLQRYHGEVTERFG